MQGLTYTVSDDIKVWRSSQSTWHYVSLSAAASEEIRALSHYHQTRRRGWGAVRVTASLDTLTWQTSIFPAFDHGCYQLFLKADIRKQASLTVGDTVTVTLQLQFGQPGVD